jgi:hypothetical protein
MKAKDEPKTVMIKIDLRSTASHGRYSDDAFAADRHGTVCGVLIMLTFIARVS